MIAAGPVDYFVVDVETANQARHSICQIGIAFFAGGKMVDGWESLINPHDQFNQFNVALHGIGPRTVARAPSWSEVLPKVLSLLNGAAVASHTDFDRGALSGACLRAAVPAVAYSKWIDTCWLARRAWPQLPNHKTAHAGPELPDRPPGPRRARGYAGGRRGAGVGVKGAANEHRRTAGRARQPHHRVSNGACSSNKQRTSWTTLRVIFGRLRAIQARPQQQLELD
jgi:hypothetical protein